MIRDCPHDSCTVIRNEFHFYLHEIRVYLVDLLRPDGSKHHPSGCQRDYLHDFRQGTTFMK